MVLQPWLGRDAEALPISPQENTTLSAGEGVCFVVFGYTLDVWLDRLASCLA